MALVPVAACLVVLLLIAWVTATGRDVWPFSAYPMFATYRSAAAVRFYQIRFVLGDGTVRTLPHVMADAATGFHRAFDRLQQTRSGDAAARFTEQLVDRYAARAAALDSRLAAVVRIEIWERAVGLRVDASVDITERRVQSFDSRGQPT